ncbi:hypothetical protein BGX31_002001 [Mortierella sp. GBA43]|nr:hypothetical protein BGX31_002001 [Mortierella sp. GBA43]
MTKSSKASSDPVKPKEPPHRVQLADPSVYTHALLSSEKSKNLENDEFKELTTPGQGERKHNLDKHASLPPFLLAPVCVRWESGEEEFLIRAVGGKVPYKALDEECPSEGEEQGLRTQEEQALKDKPE